jgi:hypothetical protein
VPSNQIFAKHKFAIVFESSPAVRGYITEKIMDAYHSKTVPIYCGAGSKKLRDRALNPRAYIDCSVPRNVSSSRYVRSLQEKHCQGMDLSISEQRYECRQRTEEVLLEILAPFFEPCIREIMRIDKDEKAYADMVAEPLAPDGKLVGVWNVSLWAEHIRATYLTIGYESPYQA